MFKSQNKKILLKVSGSVAAFKAAALASQLTQTGFEVITVLSENAQKFAGAASFEGLTGNRVYSDTFESGQAMLHLELAKQADLVLFYPITANRVNQLATGQAWDLLGTLFLAHDFKKPYWIFTAMNSVMLSHPAVQENLNKLKQWGVEVFDQTTGMHACGEVGAGRLMEPEAVLKLVKTLFINRTEVRLKRQKVLVTSGGTSEPIDAVRVLSNVSTGATGASIADALTDSGFDVKVLTAKNSIKPEKADFDTYFTFDDLQTALKKELSESSFDWVIHAAAVSDYRPESVEAHFKLSSDSDRVLNLKRNPKLIHHLKEYSKNKNLKIVAFKLTANEKQKPDLTNYPFDFVVHNDLTGIQASKNQHEGVIYQSGVAIQKFSNKKELSKSLIQILDKGVNI